MSDLFLNLKPTIDRERSSEIIQDWIGGVSFIDAGNGEVFTNKCREKLVGNGYRFAQVLFASSSRIAMIEL